MKTKRFQKISSVNIETDQPEMLNIFDSIGKGEVLQIVARNDPRNIFYEMSAERSGQFLWKYVRSGPAIWKVNIKKIAG